MLLNADATVLSAADSIAHAGTVVARFGRSVIPGSV